MIRHRPETPDLSELLPPPSRFEVTEETVPAFDVSSVTIPPAFEDGDPLAALCVVLERDFARLLDRVSFEARALLEHERPRYLGMPVYRFEAQDELLRFAAKIQAERRYVVWIRVSPP